MDEKDDKKTPMQKLEDKIVLKRDVSWNKTKDFNKNAFDFSENYKKFMNDSKTVRRCVRSIVREAKANGFSSLEEAKEFSKTGRYYIEEKNRHAALVVVGSQPISSGIRVVVSHVDSPRLDFKPYPVYEDSELGLMKSHYYGGIKKYQWVNVPMSLNCVAFLSDGKKIEFVIGENDDDPVFVAPDLLPHLAREQEKKPASKVITGEDLNVIVGSVPVDDKKVKEKVKLNVLKYLYDNYGLTEEDLVGAEIEAVPIVSARDVGLDRGLVGAYGQDDKVCVYTSLMAVVSSQQPVKTTIVLFEDKEEVGSIGNTSARSDFLKRVVEKIIILKGSDCSENVLRDIFSKSEGICADVTAGLDPSFKSVHDLMNAAVLGKGVAVEKYGGGGGKFYTNDTAPEFFAKIKHMLNKEKISWQSAEIGKIDEGGGGTMSMFLANFGIEMIDIGVPVLGMHAPFEITSKADIYSAYLAYKVFIENKF